ncbi:MAG: hypothetical protein AAGE52_35735 [Myxococcota bacterium]
MRVFFGILVGVALTLGTLVLWTYWADSTDPTRSVPAPVPPPLPLPEVLDPRPPPIPRVVYLNREGAILTGGTDDSTQNVSSIVRDVEGERLEFPAFSSSLTRWRQIVDCVRDRFEPYDVTIVDQRPVERGYVMVMIGGRAMMLGEDHDHGHARIGGLAPYNGDMILDPVVMVFSTQLRNLAREVCEVAAQEIAHAYGLDHTYDCRDLMTYRRRCGRRRWFVDEDMRCGEGEARDCHHTNFPTQNSHQRIIRAVGARPEEAPEDEP